MFDIVGIGELIVDIVYDSKNDIVLKNPGGAPFNVIVTCANYGLKTVYIGTIGNDDLGKIIMNTFDKYNIIKSHLNIFNTNTVSANVTIDSNKDRFFSFNKFNNSFTDFKSIPYLECKIFHFGTILLLDNNSRNLLLQVLPAYKKNSLIAMDANFRESEMNEVLYNDLLSLVLPYIDYLKVSYEEAKIITKKETISDIFTVLAKKTAAITILSDGKNGAYLNTKDQIYYSKAPIVTTVDTTGAGDVLFGTFLSKVLISDDWQYILDIAVKCASLSKETYGVNPLKLI